MKKLLILVLITLLLILTLFIGIKGVTMGPITILGIQGIQEKNSELDQKIQEAAKLTEKTYAQTVSEVNSNAKKLKEEKQNYQDMTIISTDDNTQTANQIEKYEIETLWVKLGNHATKEGVVMKMDVTSGSTGAEGYYNLNFTVNGGYVQIEDFVSSIENDSTLGFKIEEFKMAPSGNELQATFVCKDIPIKQVSATTTVTQNTTDGENTNNAGTSNTTGNSGNTTTNGTATTNTAGNNTTGANTAAGTTNTASNTAGTTTSSNAR